MLKELIDVYASGRNHSFILHGNTRDLQIGRNGSAPLVDHLLDTFFRQEDAQITPACYRVGVGWQTIVESHKTELANLLSADSVQDNDLSALLGETKADSSGLPTDVSSAVQAIYDLLLQSERQVAIIIDRAEFVLAGMPYNQLSPQDKDVLSLLQDAASNPIVKASGNILILITDNTEDLHQSIRLTLSRFYAIEITNPDSQERQQIAQTVIDKIKRSVDCKIGASEFARISAGLTRSGMMDIFLQARHSGVLERNQVKALKDRIVAQENGDLISFVDPLERGFEAVGGLDAIKEYCKTEVIEPMRNGEKQSIPNGFLCAGAAGLGKSFFMRALATEAGCTVIDFSVNRLLGSYVGQSEANLERAIATIKACAPVLVVIDEIDQTFPDRAKSSGQSGDSGVSNRIFKRILELLGDTRTRGDIVWIGITNYPDRLDAALARAGRFDDVLPFLPPRENEIVSLINVYLGKAGAPTEEEEALLDIAPRLIGYTGAEIETVVRKALKLQDRSKTPMSTIDALSEAIERLRSNTRSIKAMTDQALIACNDRDLVPDYYQAQWKRITNQANSSSPTQSDQSLPKEDRLF